VRQSSRRGRPSKNKAPPEEKHYHETHFGLYGPFTRRDNSDRPTEGAATEPAGDGDGTIAGKTITITYSSPRVKGREGKIYTKDG